MADSASALAERPVDLSPDVERLQGAVVDALSLLFEQMQGHKSASRFHRRKTSEIAASLDRLRDRAAELGVQVDLEDSPSPQPTRRQSDSTNRRDP